MATGLILEGGAMRGIYTAGVLDEFMKEGITFPGVIGVSAGAVHGCSYVAGQRGRSIRYYLRYCGDNRFMSARSLVTTGNIVGEQFCYHDLPERLDPFDYEGFQKSGTNFYVVCTNVRTGKAEYILCKDMRADIDYMRASASMPFVSRIVHTGGKKLLDGGVADSVPVQAFRRLGYEKNVIVLTRPADYRKKLGSTTRRLARVMYRRYPAFERAIMNRHKEYNGTLEEINRLEKAGEVFVIRPEESLKLGRAETDREKIRAVYQIGVRDARRRMEALRAFLGQTSRT